MWSSFGEYWSPGKNLVVIVQLIFSPILFCFLCWFLSLLSLFKRTQDFCEALFLVPTKVAHQPLMTVVSFQIGAFHLSPTSLSFLTKRLCVLSYSLRLLEPLSPILWTMGQDVFDLWRPTSFYILGLFIDPSPFSLKGKGNLVRGVFAVKFNRLVVYVHIQG